MNPGPSSTLLGLLSDSDQFCPLKFLHVFSIPGEPDWKIVGVSEGGENLSLWSMKRSSNDSGKSKQVIPSSLQVGQLVGKSTLTSTSKIVACAASSAAFFPLNEKPVFSLLTGGVDGVMRLWSLSGKGDSALEEIANFKLHDEGISAIRVGPLGCVATTSATCKAIQLWQFDISGTTQSFIKLLAKHIIPLPAVVPIQFDWLPLNNGNTVLAIANGNQVDLLHVQPKAELRTFVAEIHHTELWKSASPIQSLSWMKDGVLVCGALNQLCVFTKWLPPSSSHATLFHSYSATRPLPFYHPKVLVEYLIAGNIEQVALILKHLLAHLEELASWSRSRVERIFPIIVVYLLHISQYSRCSPCK